MDNFVYGIESSVRTIALLLRGVGQMQLFWGFVLGFLVSTGVYGFIVTENPKQIGTLLLYDSGTSFQKMHSMSGEGKYTVSYSSHIKLANRAKIVSSIFGIIFIFGIILALLTY